MLEQLTCQISRKFILSFLRPSPGPLLTCWRIRETQAVWKGLVHLPHTIRGPPSWLLPCFLLMPSLPHGLSRSARPLLIQALYSDPVHCQLGYGCLMPGFPRFAELCVLFLVDTWPSPELQKTKGCWVQSDSGIPIVGPHNIPFSSFWDPYLSDNIFCFVSQTQGPDYAHFLWSDSRVMHGPS